MRSELKQNSQDDTLFAALVYARLEQRGEKLQALPRGTLMYYSGIVHVPAVDFGSGHDQHMESRIIIDPEEHNKVNGDIVITDPMYPMPRPDANPFVPSLVPNAAPILQEKEDQELSSEQLAMASSTIRGFMLSTKTWNEVEVDGLSDVQWDGMCGLDKNTSSDLT